MQDATTPFKFLFLTAVEARNLKNVQMIGKQDPYLKLWVGRAGTKVQTRVDDGAGTSATWGESFKFSVERLHAEEFLYFKVKNKNITDTKTIGSGKVAIKMFGSTMQGKWYKLYDPNGRDAGEILLEGRLSRRGDMNQSMGDPGQNLLNASAERGAPSMGPSAPIAWGAGGARPSTQWHAPMNQSSIASFSSARPSNAAYYSGSGHHHPDLSPGSSSTGTAVPSMPSRWGNGSTSASAASSSFPVHRPSLSLPSAPAQSQFVEQRPNHHSGHPRRASNTGMTTGGIPIAWANRPASATPASSHFPGPTAPPSLPALPAQSGVMGQRSSPYGGPRSYGGSRRLPHGWEEKVASTGRTFYVDHTTKTTSWVRPGEASHGVSR